MAARNQVRAVNQLFVPMQITARSLLLVSSGIVRKCDKETLMTRIRKQITKWGLPVAKV